MQLYKNDPSSLSASLSFCPHSCISLLCHHFPLMLIISSFFIFFNSIPVNMTYSFACLSPSPSGPPCPSLSLSLSLSFCHVSGGHSRNNSGTSESSIPNLARSLLLVDQLIDL